MHSRTIFDTVEACISQSSVESTKRRPSWLSHVIFPYNAVVVGVVVCVDVFVVVDVVVGVVVFVVVCVDVAVEVRVVVIDVVGDVRSQLEKSPSS